MSGGSFKRPKNVDVGFVKDPVDDCYRWKLLDISHGVGRSRIIPCKGDDNEIIMSCLYEKYLRPGL